MKEKQKNITLILSIVFAAAFLAVGVLYFMQNKKMNTIVTELKGEKDNLQSEFRELLFEYDSLKPQTDTLLLMLDKEQQKVAQLMEELETVKVTNASKMREYRKELTTMRRVLKHYVVQIDSLNKVNEVLTAENQKVKQQYNQVTQQINKLEKEKENLNETIDRAARLEAFDFNIIEANSKGRKTRRFKKIQRFKVQFKLSKNITTEPGEKEVYLRISDPNLEVLLNSESGKFTYENKRIDYSSKQQIEYEGEEMQMEMYYDITQFIFEGNFQFSVFVDGNLIGTYTKKID